MKLYLLLCFNCFVCTISAQSYFNTVLETNHSNQAGAWILLEEEQYVYPYIYINESDGVTKFSLLSTNLSTSHTLEIDSLRTWGFPLTKMGDDFLVTGKRSNASKFNSLLLVKVSSDKKSVLWSREFITEGTTTNNLLNQVQGMNLYSLNLSRYRFTTADSIDRDQLSIYKFDESGNVVWNKNYSDNASYVYPWQFISTFNNNLLWTEIFNDLGPANSKARISTISSNGRLLSQVALSETPFSGAEPIWITQLSDSTFVAGYKVKMDDPNYPIELFSQRPIKLEWYTQDFDLIREKKIVSPRFNQIINGGIKSGNGNYFFGYGQHADVNEYTYSGSITKFSNQGDTIWSRRYLHPNYNEADDDHFISDLHELPNGDLVGFGRVRRLGELSKPWLFKVNSNGCFSQNSCDDDLYQISDVKEQSILNKEPLFVFPNPVYDQFKISFEGMNGKETYLEVFNSQGHRLVGTSYLINEELRADELSSGVYYFKLHDGNDAFNGKFVKI